MSPGEHGRRLPGASVPRTSPPKAESLANYRSTSERFTHLLNPFALFLQSFLGSRNTGSLNLPITSLVLLRE